MQFQSIRIYFFAGNTHIPQVPSTKPVEMVPCFVELLWHAVLTIPAQGCQRTGFLCSIILSTIRSKECSMLQIVSAHGQSTRARFRMY